MRKSLDIVNGSIVKDISGNLEELQRLIQNSVCVLFVGFSEQGFQELFAREPGYNPWKRLTQSSTVFLRFDLTDSDLVYLRYLLSLTESYHTTGRHCMIIPKEQLLVLRSELLWKHPTIKIILYQPGIVSNINLVDIIAKYIRPSISKVVSEKKGSRRVSSATESIKSNQSISPDGSPSSITDNKQFSPSQQGQSIIVYFSYAPEDKRLQEQLQLQLQPMDFQGRKISWRDGQIPAGRRWEVEMKKLVCSADVILILITANSLNSYAQMNVEMANALKSEKALVIPIIMHSCAWDDTQLIDFVVLPRSKKPVAESNNRHKAFYDVAREIQKAINGELLF